ncbi:MAG TPA: BatD family protein, partial [bacterium]|nr:BatD family protein [bacterium]
MPGSAFSDDYQVSLLLSRNSVNVGEQFYLQVEVKGTSRDIPSPSLPDVDGLDFFSGGTTSSFQIINGNVQSSKTFAYSVFARKEGTYTLDSVQVEIGGKVYKAQPATITVSAPAGQPGQGAPQPGQPHASQGQPSPQETPQSPPTESIMLKAIPENTTVYANQGIVLQYILYKHPQIQLGGNIQFENLQSTLFQGFWQEEIPMQPRSVGTQNIGNAPYDVIELKKYVLFPLKPEAVQIEP